MTERPPPVTSVIAEHGGKGSQSPGAPPPPALRREAEIYRTPPGACLACSTPLDAMGRRLVCPGCRSCLVPDADVDAAIRAMAGDEAPGARFTLVPITGGFARPRPCPRCAAVMAPCMLAAIPIDRCAAHGLWFDHDELERVLFAAAPKPPDDELGAVATAGGVLDGAGRLLELLGIFLP